MLIILCISGRAAISHEDYYGLNMGLGGGDGRARRSPHACAQSDHKGLSWLYPTSSLCTRECPRYYKSRCIIVKHTVLSFLVGKSYHNALASVKAWIHVCFFKNVISCTIRVLVSERLNRLSCKRSSLYICFDINHLQMLLISDLTNCL